MYKIYITDYISVCNSNDEEVLHIELDALDYEIYEQIGKLVDDINKKLGSIESEDK